MVSCAIEKKCSPTCRIGATQTNASTTWRRCGSGSPESRGINHLTMPEGQPMVDVRFTDVFVYRQNRWLAVSAQETPVRPPEQKP